MVVRDAQSRSPCNLLSPCAENRVYFEVRGWKGVEWLCESDVSGRGRWVLGGGSHSSGRDDQLAVVDEGVNG